MIRIVACLGSGACSRRLDWKQGFFFLSCFFSLLACKPRAYSEAALMVAGVAGTRFYKPLVCLQWLLQLQSMPNLLHSGVTIEVPLTMPNNLATTDLCYLRAR
jgi:hypothetical protein